MDSSSEAYVASKFIFPELPPPAASTSMGFWDQQCRNVEMATTQLLLNEVPVTITAEASVIKRMNEDDQYLADYVNRAAKMGQFSFIFRNQQPLKKIVVKRTSPFVPLQPVWYKKGRPSETDLAATALLVKLRGSEKYIARFKDGYSLRNGLWDEIANEMRVEGYDVDGIKCSQKFLNMAQGYYKYRQFVESCDCNQKMYPPDFYSDLHRILGGEGGSKCDANDEEWLPSSKTSVANNNNKRKRMQAAVEEDEDDFYKKFLKLSGEQKEERFKQICSLINKRNDIMRERVKQNEKIINLLQKLADKN